VEKRDEIGVDGFFRFSSTHGRELAITAINGHSGVRTGSGGVVVLNPPPLSFIFFVTLYRIVVTNDKIDKN